MRSSSRSTILLDSLCLCFLSPYSLLVLGKADHMLKVCDRLRRWFQSWFGWGGAALWIIQAGLELLALEATCACWS